MFCFAFSVDGQRRIGACVGDASPADACAGKPTAQRFAAVSVRSAILQGVVFAIVAVFVLIVFAFKSYALSSCARLVRFACDAHKIAGIFVIAETTAFCAAKGRIGERVDAFSVACNHAGVACLTAIIIIVGIAITRRIAARANIIFERICVAFFARFAIIVIGDDICEFSLIAVGRTRRSVVGQGFERASVQTDGGGDRCKNKTVRQNLFFQYKRHHRHKRSA